MLVEWNRVVSTESEAVLLEMLDWRLRVKQESHQFPLFTVRKKDYVGESSRRQYLATMQHFCVNRFGIG